MFLAAEWSKRDKNFGKEDEMVSRNKNIKTRCGGDVVCFHLFIKQQHHKG